MAMQRATADSTALRGPSVGKARAAPATRRQAIETAIPIKVIIVALLYDATSLRFDDAIGRILKEYCINH